MLRFSPVSPYLLLFTLSIAVPAAADGFHYDSCTAVGESCSNAIPGSPESGSFVPPPITVPGTCRDVKCRSPGPDGDIVYDCLRCVELSGGTGGTGGTAGTGGAPSTGGSESSGGVGGSELSGGTVSTGGAPLAGTGGSDSSSGCDCRTSGVAPQRSFAALLLLVGLISLAISRRRAR